MSPEPLPVAAPEFLGIHFVIGTELLGMLKATNIIVTTRGIQFKTQSVPDAVALTQLSNWLEHSKVNHRLNASNDGYCFLDLDNPADGRQINLYQ